MTDLQDFIKIANSEFGDNTAILIDGEHKSDVDVIPTGIESVDNSIGIGGIPRGKITEVFGKEASGKTTLCLHAIAEANKMGLNSAFIDTEHAINFERMKDLGVDTDKLVFSQPDSGEDALNLVELMVRSGKFAIIVVDSVAALIPQIEVEKDMGDNVMGRHAMLMSQAMRKLTAPVNKNNVALMFVNQTRSKIGSMWGNPETTTGGVALKFYSSLRLKMVYTGKIKEGGVQVSSKGKMVVVKNKLAVPFKEAEFEIGKDGINSDTMLVAMLLKKGILEKAGAWIKFNGETVGQGLRGMTAKLKEDPELKKQIMTALSQKG